MSPVLEARVIKKFSTSSRQENGLYDYFDQAEPMIAHKLFQLPTFTVTSEVDRNWCFAIGTARLNESLYLRSMDLIDLINGPVIPAKKKISVTLNIRSFKKGQPLSYELGP